VARALDTVEEHLGEQAPTHPAGKSSASTGPAAGRPGELAMSQRDAARRIRTFDEVTGGLDSLTALFEARRCMSCGNCFGCDKCYGVCPDNAVIKLGTRGVPVRDRLRLLQGLRPVRRRMPLRRRRDGTRIILKVRIPPRHHRRRRFTRRTG